MTPAIRPALPLVEATKPPVRVPDREGSVLSTIGVRADEQAKQLSLRALEDAWGGCGRLPLNCSLRVILLVMSELEKLHALGQVHGELTPAHIGLSEHGNVALAPPGRFPPQPKDRRRHHFRYFAPEKLQERAVDARADVFSVGVLLWEALAGTPLLDASTPEEILARWRTGAAPLAPARSLVLWARSLSYIAARALAVEPDARYASVQQLHAAVELLGGAHAAKLTAWSALLRWPLPPKIAKSSRSPESARTTLAQAELDGRPLRDLFHGLGRWEEDTIFDLNAGPPDLELEPAMPNLEPNFRLDSQTPDDELPTRFVLASGRNAAAAASRLPTPTAFAAEPMLVSARAQPPPLPFATGAPAPLPAPQAEGRKQPPTWLSVVLMAVISGAVLAVIAGGNSPAPTDQAVPSARLAAAPFARALALHLKQSPLPSPFPSPLAIASANPPGSLPATSAPAVRRSVTIQTAPLASTPTPTGRRRPPQAYPAPRAPDYGI